MPLVQSWFSWRDHNNIIRRDVIIKHFFRKYNLQMLKKLHKDSYHQDTYAYMN